MKTLSQNYKTTSTMFKKATIALALIMAPVVTFAQSVFDKFEDHPDVASVVVNQKMFSMIASLDLDMEDAEDQQMMEMIKKITGLKVFTTDNAEVSADMNATVNKYLKSSDLEELMRIKDGDQTVKFYVREGKDENHVKELLMFVNGLKEMTQGQDITINGEKREFESVLLTLTGDIDLRQISKLTNSMDLPGGDQLNKVEKKG